MATFTHDEDLTVPPLTDAERAWIKKLDAAFKARPTERLRLVEIGDHAIVVDYDAVIERNLEINDGLAGTHGVQVASLDHAYMKITSVSG